MSEHEDRLRAIRNAFTAANGELIGAIESLDDATVATAPEGAWNAAQIGWHVATTNEFLAGAMAGAIADLVVPRSDDFSEQLAGMEFPQKIKTFPQLEPPADTTRETAISQLKASESAFAGALDRVTESRCAEECVRLPFGVFSLYEIGEFTAVHVRRHLGQLRRTVAT